MPSMKTILQMAGVTLAVIAVVNNVPQIGRIVKG